MKIIKCSGNNCSETQEVEEECVGWYCRPCMERIMENMKSWLDSDKSKKIDKRFWEDVEKDYLSKELY